MIKMSVYKLNRYGEPFKHLGVFPATKANAVKHKGNLCLVAGGIRDRELQQNTVCTDNQ